MKVYISADIEGVTGVTAWDEATRTTPDYPQYQRQMTREVAAACQGALEAGATEILVKDAHSTARNIIAEELPRQVRLIRGWSRHPYMMMQELDSSFDAAVMVGYHAMAGSGDNPLAHTMYSSKISEMRINGTMISEFLMNAYTAGLENVPVVFISGDKGVCDQARQTIPGITTVAVKEGIGDSTISLHPDTAADQIRSEVAASLKQVDPDSVLVPGGPFEVLIRFTDFKLAYRAGFYPGASHGDPGHIRFICDHYLDILRLMLFI